MTTGNPADGALRRGARLFASLAIMAFSAACAIDVTEYTPFATDGKDTQVARNAEPDLETTAKAKARSETVVVRHGDTLYRIARRNETSVDRIARANGLAEPYVIRSGQRLVLPDGRVASVAPASATVNARVVGSTSESRIKGGVRVERDDTLYSIARQHRVHVRDLMTANAIDDPVRLRPGQVLMLPYQRTANSRIALVGSPEITGSVSRQAKPRLAAKSRQQQAEEDLARVMREFRMVPGQSILAPF